MFVQIIITSPEILLIEAVYVTTLSTDILIDEGLGHH